MLCESGELTLVQGVETGRFLKKAIQNWHLGKVFVVDWLLISDFFTNQFDIFWPGAELKEYEMKSLGRKSQDLEVISQ